MRRYDATIWLDGFYFASPSKIVTVHSDEGGFAVMRALEQARVGRIPDGVPTHEVDVPPGWRNLFDFHLTPP